MIINERELKEKIHACWLGKNLGGTVGGPFEGVRGPVTEVPWPSADTEPLPNDDLDLQLLWLRALDELGPERVDAHALAAYWVSYVGPSWDEYGVAKSNLRAGIRPPLSGTYCNSEWKDSNGAWIRTEIWACTHPGFPDEAVRFAWEDAIVDHGAGEGTRAALFMAAMQSAAFVTNSLETAIEAGLARIPEGCAVARYIAFVRKALNEGMTCGALLQAIEQMSLADGFGWVGEDKSWLGAPACIAFTVAALLLGEGDMETTLRTAVTFGDDADCTCAAAGATLGILKGMACIPEALRPRLEEIKTVSLVNGYGFIPATCEELTRCVLSLLPVTLRTPNADLVKRGPRFAVTAGASDFSDVLPTLGTPNRALCARSETTFVTRGLFADFILSYEGLPQIAPEGTLTLSLTALLTPNMSEQKHFFVKAYLPDGWTVSGPNHLHASHPSAYHGRRNGSLQAGASTVTLTLTAGPAVAPINRGVLELTVPGNPEVTLIPLVVTSESKGTSCPL